MELGVHQNSWVVNPACADPGHGLAEKINWVPNLAWSDALASAHHGGNWSIPLRARPPRQCLISIKATPGLHADSQVLAETINFSCNPNMDVAAGREHHRAVSETRCCQIG
jgi:hypothetical protein